MRGVFADLAPAVPDSAVLADVAAPRRRHRDARRFSARRLRVSSGASDCRKNFPVEQRMRPVAGKRVCEPTADERDATAK